MAGERIGDMTREELEQLVLRFVDKRMRQYSYVLGRDDRSPQAVWESILTNIIEPAPGTPSALDLLREDRDR